MPTLDQRAHETPTPIIPKLVRHPAPNLAIDTDWLEEAGCKEEYDDDDRYEWRPCTPDSPLGTLGCEEILIDDYLGGLPSPVVQCYNWGDESPDPLKFERTGCFFLVGFTTYVMFKDNTYQLINGIDEFQAMFAPIESSDEALSYALVTTGLDVNYEEEPVSYEYLVEETENTHVDELPDGYSIHLFADPEPGCGCDTHTVRAVDILVTKDGRIRETKAQPIYQMEACFD